MQHNSTKPESHPYLFFYILHLLSLEGLILDYFENQSKISQSPFFLSIVTPQEHSELVTHYLCILKLRKEKYILNNKPTNWELLTREEKLILAAYHSHH
ncbi:hypothetical protein VP01_1992g3 [Puccinia sorghi]|uniref:Uncharacterized protein n=1 Tax=Puccinia sorghi TaxID=27349 RepID=A0A0L6VBM0_9BASI|nr:hypothetical protein VP01_1992g3 [Puccinia sorghi]